MSFSDGESELSELRISLPELGIDDVTTVEDFFLTHNYLNPTSQWSFTIGGNAAKDLAKKPLTGTKVVIRIDNNIHCTGQVDISTESYTRQDGFRVKLDGTDILGPVVKGTVDPKIKLNTQSTIRDVNAMHLAPFGIDTIHFDASLDRNVLTGKGGKTNSVLSSKTFTDANGVTKTVNVLGDSSVEQLTLKKLTPKPGDGAYAFLDKVNTRFGFKMHALADGSGVLIDKPDFDQQPIQTVKHLDDSDFGLTANNVIQGNVVRNLTDQPSVILAVCKGGEAFEGKKTQHIVAMVNEIVGVLDEDGTIDPQVDEILERYNRSVTVLDYRPALYKHRADFNESALVFKPLFLESQEAKTQDQLEKFVRREMAKRQFKAFTAKYTVESWTQDGVPFAANTMVNVEDEPFNVNEPLWVLERTFRKNRQMGTRTELTLVRPHTVEF